MEKSRRKFLKTATKVAIYTPPAMMAISMPSLKAIAKSACNNGVGNGGDCLPPGLDWNGRDDLDNDDHGGTPGNPQNRK